jgi:hypothetical protein
MMRSHSVALLCALSSSAWLAPLPAQDKPAVPAPAAKPSWPKLDALKTDRVAQLVANFKMDNQELHTKSFGELVELGAGAAPILIGRVSDTPGADKVNAWLIRALAQITAIEHAPLLVPDASSKVLARRRWAVGRLVDLGAPGLVDLFKKALADKDEEVAFRAAVGLVASGDPAGLDKTLARAKSDWKGCREFLEANLPRGRGIEVSNWLAAKSDAGEFAEKVAALRLFRSCGDRAHARKISSLLDSSDNGVKKEAINALRVVVLGEKPLDDLSVFQVIDMAKEIKAKL